MDMSQSAHNRQSRRSPVFLTATLDDDGRQLSVILRNMSEHGALVEGDWLPDEGASVYFERKDIRVKARVVWVHERYAGLAFDRELQREELLRSVPQPRPAKPDIGTRRPGFASQPLTESERTILNLWMTQVPTLGPKS